MKSLRVATCQFSVEPQIAHNRRATLRQMEDAQQRGAQVVHFSECALSGYAGVDIPNVAAIDWDELTDATRDIQAAAKRLKLWVLLGSTHQLSDGHKPHNSVYVINSRGKIVERWPVDEERQINFVKRHGSAFNGVYDRVKTLAERAENCMDMDQLEFDEQREHVLLELAGLPFKRRLRAGLQVIFGRYQEN